MPIGIDPPRRGFGEGQETRRALDAGNWGKRSCTLAPQPHDGVTLGILFLTSPEQDTDAQTGVSTWLSSEERQKLTALGSLRRRRQFLAARALTRHLLAQTFGISAHGLSIVSRDDGTPYCREWPTASLSIAHSGAWIACAVATAGRVGIDVETRRPGRNWRAIAAQYLPQGTAVDSEAGFYRAWTRHEALYKLDRSLTAGHPADSDPADLHLYQTMLDADTPLTAAYRPDDPGGAQAECRWTWIAANHRGLYEMLS